MADGAEYVFDPARVLFFPLRQHLLDQLSLQLWLRTAQVAGNDRELTGLGVPGDVLLVAVGQWADHHVPAIVRQKLGWHGLQSSAIEKIQEQGLDNVIAMVAKSDPGNAVFCCKPVKRTTTQPGTQTASRFSLGDDALDDAIGVLLYHMERNSDLLRIPGQHMLRKARLFLIQVNRKQLEVDGRALLQVHQDVEQGKRVFSSRQANHHAVAISDHVEICDGLAGVMEEPFDQLAG